MQWIVVYCSLRDAEKYVVVHFNCVRILIDWDMSLRNSNEPSISCWDTKRLKTAANGIQFGFHEI